MLAGYKTLFFSVFTLVLTGLDLFINDGTMLSVIFGDPKHAALALVVLKTISLILRWYTTTPMFTSQQEVEAKVVEKIITGEVEVADVQKQG